MKRVQESCQMEKGEALESAMTIHRKPKVKIHYADVARDSSGDGGGDDQERMTNLDDGYRLWP